MLLRQVSLELPFLARHGLIMDKWATVAWALVAADEFTRTDLDTKKANNGFNALVDGHRKHNNEAERASGVSEEVSEKILLLNAFFLKVRDEAMMSLGKRKQVCDVAGDVGGTSKDKPAVPIIINTGSKRNKFK
ncbi:hypothetical protein H257_05272 [Aphanomyces astaci]|uniref:Uncharacterized protein n=1 Tax=Aphanomyces astaci TaxID=112090 RepID=W4GPJ3_APHAT|nr:hypothetical protein H257_05272 [Aphanomyces astaci]ETV81645.1 hypothetical protein H257_05272 [Aphanomyces astaci]|eukprot:XP_009828382.1 hypothetical protein H257_05272 [Aphanomyces astaci]